MNTNGGFHEQAVDFHTKKELVSKYRLNAKVISHSLCLWIKYTKDYTFSILPSIEEACENLNGIIRYGRDFTIIYLNFFVIRIYSAAPPRKREEMLTWLSNSYEEETKDGQSFTDLSELLELLIRVSGLRDRDDRVKYLDKESYDLVQYGENKRV